VTAANADRGGFGFQVSDLRFRICAWRSVTLFFFALSLCLGISAPARGQANAPSNPSSPPRRSPRCASPANPHQRYFECVGQRFDSVEETLTKNWAGFRPELNGLGIIPTASYTAQLLGNPSGGQSRGFTYSGTLQASIFWDFDKLIGVPGLSFNIGGGWSTGKNLSADYVKNIFAVQSAYTAPDNGTNNLTLGEIYLQQQLFNNSLLIAVGRLTPQSTFATMPVLNQFLNVGINPVPGHLGINDQTFTAYPPGVEWGVQALYNITPSFQIAAGVFNTNQNSAAGGKGGLDFSLHQGNRGALSVVQLNYLFNHVPEDVGLPGQYTLGGFYDGNRFTSLSTANASASGTYSIYGMFQQMVYRDGGPGSQKGLTVWGETAIAPKSSVNTMPYFLGGGLSYQGVITGRDNDIVSAGLIYGTFSRYIPRTTAETVLEVNYQITVTRWLSITPDLQYVIRPGGSSAIGNALVLGTQAVISF
jgi:porin